MFTTKICMFEWNQKPSLGQKNVYILILSILMMFDMNISFGILTDSYVYVKYVHFWFVENS